MKKKKYEESFSSNDNNKDSENMDQINELDDFEADGWSTDKEKETYFIKAVVLYRLSFHFCFLSPCEHQVL